MMPRGCGAGRAGRRFVQPRRFREP